jgi:hypothetical protein
MRRIVGDETLMNRQSQFESNWKDVIHSDEIHFTSECEAWQGRIHHRRYFLDRIE